MGVAGFFIDKVTFFAFKPTTGARSYVPDKEFTVDASVEEKHPVKVLTPKHPTFKGKPVTDNVRPEADQFRCVVVFSNTAVNAVDAGLKLAKGLSYAEDVREQFEQFMKTGWTWTINTSLKIYENMLLSDMDVPRSAHHGNIIEMALTFNQVRSASVAFVNAQTRQPAKGNQKAVEHQAAKPTSAGPNTSTLKTGLKFVAGKFK